jgi:hypothetical protein
VQQVKLCMKHVATHHIQTAGGTIGTAQESKILCTQTDEISPETLGHLSYQSMSKATSCQRHPNQHSWWHKRICILHNQI